MNVAALVGGQYGSEGKGLIAGHIAKDYDNHVRVGAANAGHTVYTCDMQGPGGAHIDSSQGGPMWHKHVMQSIPCAAYANPDADLFIGPGALISNDILQNELDLLCRWRRDRGMPPPRLFVDPRAHVITEKHIEREQRSDLAERIGSTSTIAREGIGAAQAARVMREAGCVTAEGFYRGDEKGINAVLTDVPLQLRMRPSILLEGTQGADLSLTTGNFPYVTSRNTTSAGLCADCGVAPNRLDRVIMVCRTYPIRVAGPSGPFWSDSTEIEWEDIGIDPEKERTTVTKKVRRVATFSLAQINQAAALNGATEIALTFCDYVDPAIKGYGSPVPLSVIDMRYPKIADMIDTIEEAVHVPITMLGTGPHSVIDLVREVL